MFIIICGWFKRWICRDKMDVHHYFLKPSIKLRRLSKSWSWELHSPRHTVSSYTLLEFSKAVWARSSATEFNESTIWSDDCTATTMLKTNPKNPMTAAGTRTIKLPSTGTSPKIGMFRVGPRAVSGSIRVKLAIKGSKRLGGTGGGGVGRDGVAFILLLLTSPESSEDLRCVVLEAWTILWYTGMKANEQVTEWNATMTTRAQDFMDWDTFMIAFTGSKGAKSTYSL